MDQNRDHKNDDKLYGDNMPKPVPSTQPVPDGSEQEEIQRILKEVGLPDRYQKNRTGGASPAEAHDVRPGAGADAKQEHVFVNPFGSPAPASIEKSGQSSSQKSNGAPATEQTRDTRRPKPPEYKDSAPNASADDPTPQAKRVDEKKESENAPLLGQAKESLLFQSRAGAAAASVPQHTDQAPQQPHNVATDADNTPAPTPPGRSEAVRTPQPDRAGKQTRHKISSVHTLRDDLQHVVRDQHMSLVQAATLEQEKKRFRENSSVQETEQRPPRRPRRTGVYIAVLALFVLGGSALAAVYYTSQTPEKADALPETDVILFAEQTRAIMLEDVEPFQIKHVLGETRTQSTLSLGAIMRVIPSTSSDSAAAPRPATAQEFFSAIGASVPEQLLRSLDQSFFFGIHTIHENVPVLVLKITSYERAFAGMLAWENIITSDLSPPFTMIPRTRMTETDIEQVLFEDIVIRNYDVRALTDTNGDVLFLYTFPNRSTLIIAESPYTLVEVLSRLSAQRSL